MSVEYSNGWFPVTDDIASYGKVLLRNGDFLYVGVFAHKSKDKYYFNIDGSSVLRKASHFWPIPHFLHKLHIASSPPDMAEILSHGIITPQLDTMDFVDDESEVDEAAESDDFFDEMEESGGEEDGTKYYWPQEEDDGVLNDIHSVLGE